MLVIMPRGKWSDSAMGEKAFNILGSIVTVALVAVVVSSPNMSRIIQAFGSAFSGAINAAQRV
jgi:hypothetical protein